MNIALYDEEGLCVRILDKIKIKGKEIWIDYKDGESDVIGYLNDDDPNDIYWNIDGSIYPYFTIVSTTEPFEQE
jgi:hypothetical protein